MCAQDNSVEKNPLDLKPTRRALTLSAISSFALFALSAPAKSFEFTTLKRAIEHPDEFFAVMNLDSVKRAQAILQRQIRGVKEASAEEANKYTAEYEEFVTAVRSAGKVKIDGAIVENPTEEQLLKAWRAEELRRALEREQKNEEPLTRPVRLAKEPGSSEVKTFYLPPVVTKESSPDALALAKHLKEIGATMYGAYWCSHCYGQKQILGRQAAEEYLKYVECDKRGAYNQRDFCKEKKVPGFPTWEIKGELYPGEKDLAELGRISGFTK